MANPLLRPYWIGKADDSVAKHNDINSCASIREARRIQSRICRLVGRFLKKGNEAFERLRYSRLRLETAGTAAQAHHIFQQAVMTYLPGYTRGFGLAMPLLGRSTTIGTPHYLATQEQRKRRGQPAAKVARAALVAAGCSVKDARTIVKAVENYNTFRGWFPPAP